jgi:hypothetical protein
MAESQRRVPQTIRQPRGIGKCKNAAGEPPLLGGAAWAVRPKVSNTPDRQALLRCPGPTGSKFMCGCRLEAALIRDRNFNIVDA